MKRYSRFGLALIFAGLLGASTSAQNPTSPSNQTLLTVGGQVDHPLQLTRADLDKKARQTVRAKDHDGKEYAYEGVVLADILRTAAVKLGEQLRGKALATCLLVTAADGYEAVFALPEFDPTANDRVIIIADRRDGQPLPANAAPFQIIVPGDKQHARWVRQVKSLTILPVTVR